MNNEDIIRMAREAGFADGIAEIMGLEGFYNFAAIVTAEKDKKIEQLREAVAAEREACAKYVAESFGKELVDGQDVAAAIRARGSDGISN